MYTPKGRPFLIKVFVAYLGIMSVFGLFEALTGANPFIGYLSSHGLKLPEQRGEYIRFGLYRAQGFTIWCSVFGTACGLGLTYLLHLYFNGRFKGTAIHYALLSLLLIGVVACATRTIIAMTAIALVSILGYLYSNIKKFMPLICVAIVLFVFAQDVMYELIDSFINHEDAGGSSVEMRAVQYAAAYSFFEDSPIWGNGLGYVEVAKEKSMWLLGAESIIFKLLIDRGTIGIATDIFFVLHGLYVLYFQKNNFLIFSFSRSFSERYPHFSLQWKKRLFLFTSYH